MLARSDVAQLLAVLSRPARPAHNGAVNGNPQAPACPRCGHSGNVHSIQELAAMARMQLGQAQPGNPMQPGYAQQPQAGPLRGPGGGRYQPQVPSYGSAGDDLAGMAIAEGARFVGRMIGKRIP